MSKEEKKKPQVSGLLSILMSVGFGAALAIAITEATSDEEKIPQFIKKGKTPVIFMTQMDSKVDDKICLPLEGTVWDKDSSGRPKIPSDLHPNCVLGDTEIESDDVVCVMRSFYSGPLVEVTTSKGAKISVTPNHMFLTPQGFVTADFLRKGDNIINSSNSKRKTSSFYPNNNRKPTTIKQIFDSLVESLGMSSTSVPATSKDFHGDARFSQGNIDIVWSNCFLSNTRKPSFLKHFLTNLFNRRSTKFLSFYSNSSLASFLKSTLHSSDRILSSSRQTTSFFRGRLRHTQIHGFTSSPNGNVILAENFSEVHSTTLQLISKSLKRFSSLVTLDEIVNVEIRFFSGHVYDIQTPSTLYSGNSIILSNCRCFYIDGVTGENLGQI